MAPTVRILAAIVGVALFAAPAPAQFLGLRRSYFGPYAGPYYGPYASPYYAPYSLAASPWRAAHSGYRVPLVHVQPQELIVHRPVPPTPPSASDIRVSIDGTSKYSATIAAAIVENKKLLEPGKGPTPGQSATVDEAKQKIKRAFDKEKGAAEMTNLRNKLVLARNSGVPQQFDSALNQSEKANAIPETISAIRDYLTFRPNIPSMTASDVRLAVDEILQNLK